MPASKTNSRAPRMSMKTEMAAKPCKTSETKFILEQGHSQNRAK